MSRTTFSSATITFERIRDDGATKDATDFFAVLSCFITLGLLITLSCASTAQSDNGNSTAAHNDSDLSTNFSDDGINVAQCLPSVVESEYCLVEYDDAENTTKWWLPSVSASSVESIVPWCLEDATDMAQLEHEALFHKDKHDDADNISKQANNELRHNAAHNYSAPSTNFSDNGLKLAQRLPSVVDSEYCLVEYNDAEHTTKPWLPSVSETSVESIVPWCLEDATDIGQLEQEELFHIERIDDIDNFSSQASTEIRHIQCTEPKRFIQLVDRYSGTVEEIRFENDQLPSVNTCEEISLFGRNDNDVEFHQATCTRVSEDD
ncbi:hypothetical protein ACA910_006719 [Epithemia clementina (nom. ined.)]